MGNKFKDINIKIHTHCFLNDLINIESFDPNKINKDEKSGKNIPIYYIG